MRAHYRINWKSGMRLSDAVFTASDDFHASRLRPLYELMLKDGYGHISQPRFRCEIDNSEMSVIEMNVTALTPDGSLIDVMFDHNERDLFQKLPVPDSREPFIVYLEQSAHELDTFDDKDIPYRTQALRLVFKEEDARYSNPDAIAVARFEYRQCWMMDTAFIPPCVVLKANADLWNRTHVYSRVLSELAAALPSKVTSEMGAEVLSIMPVVSMLAVEMQKEPDGMTPRRLVTVMQQVVSAVVSVFGIRMPDSIEDYDACMRFLEAEFVSNRIEPLVNEGIRLTQVLMQMIVGLRQRVAPQPEPEPERPVAPRVVRQPRVLDTSSERKSFKSRK